MSTIRRPRGLRTRLRMAGDAVTANIRKEMDHFGAVVLDDMKAGAPPDDPSTPGYSVDQLRKVVSSDGLAVKIGIIGVRASRKAFWLRFFEFGTVKMAARPFMHPAFERNKMLVKEKIIPALRDAMKKAGIR